MFELKNDLLFKNITTLEIGGRIKFFIEARTEKELIEALGFAKKEDLPYLVIGSGSNLLVSDKGFEGLVVRNSIDGINFDRTGGGERGAPSSARSEVATSEDVGWGSLPTGPGEKTLVVKSGTILQDLVDFANSKGLSGLQKLTGIPGTVGGAVYGNAGAYGQTISGHILSVVILASPRDQDLITLTKEQCKFSYRDSIFKQTKYIILEVVFELEEADPETLRKESKEILEKRLIKYPKGIKCPGSFFMNIVAKNLSKEVLQNIPKDMIIYGKIPAGVLLEAVGAKGDKLGNIEIAPYHANLFVNKGKGSAEDFYTLAKKYFEKVKEKFGIALEPEVQLINLPNLS